jgi:8-oxo-dGTP pyrophosphatase MutT (NUDIX family)
LTPSKTPEEMRAWIVSRLDPIETYDPTQRPHHSDFDLNPHLAPESRIWTPAAVLVGLVEHEAGLTVLLTRRADALRLHSGQVAFPGGRTDPGETPWEAALREAHEEVGLDPALVALAGLASTFRTGSGYEITPVVGFIQPGFTTAPNPHEVADIFETPFVFLMNPDNHERHALEREGVVRHFYAMTHDQRRIWGATAAMLRGLSQRLYGEESPGLTGGDPGYG